MFDQLQTEVPQFRSRLSETIAWCLNQRLESDPSESAEIQERRRLGAEAARLAQRAFLSGGPAFWKAHLRRRAKLLYQAARLGEITPPLAQQLRSPFLRPEPFDHPQSSEDRLRIIEALSERRAEQLRLEQRYPQSAVDLPRDGRLLLYAPDENLGDGAAEYTSMGFFDVDNTPPWDTWICYFDEKLISWCRRNWSNSRAGESTSIPKNASVGLHRVKLLSRNSHATQTHPHPGSARLE